MSLHSVIPSAVLLRTADALVTLVKTKTVCVNVIRTVQNVTKLPACAMEQMTKTTAVTKNRNTNYKNQTTRNLEKPKNVFLVFWFFDFLVFWVF